MVNKITSVDFRGERSPLAGSAPGLHF